VISVALWSIQKVDNLAGIASGLVCLAGESPVNVTLKDLDTGNVIATNLCMPIGTADPCALTTIRSTGGFRPADWDTECP